MSWQMADGRLQIAEQMDFGSWILEPKADQMDFGFWLPRRFAPRNDKDRLSPVCATTACGRVR